MKLCKSSLQSFLLLKISSLSKSIVTFTRQKILTKIKHQKWSEEVKAVVLNSRSILAGVISLSLLAISGNTSSCFACKASENRDLFTISKQRKLFVNDYMRWEEVFTFAKICIQKACIFKVLRNWSKLFG